MNLTKALKAIIFIALIVAIIMNIQNATKWQKQNKALADLIIKIESRWNEISTNYDQLYEIYQIELDRLRELNDNLEQDAKNKTVGVSSVEYEVYEVTAYTAGPESTGKHPGDPAYGITASGVPVRENHTLACPPSMPFGTEIYIPFFNNTFVCEDRGGAITEGRLDVYMENLSDALEFGRRKLEVLVLDKP